MVPIYRVVKPGLGSVPGALSFQAVPQSFQELLAAYLRRRSGMSATALGEQTGVPQSTMSRISLGQRPPDLDKLDPWADVLELDGEERDDFIVAGQLSHCPRQVVELIARQDEERDALLLRIERLEAAVRALKGDDPAQPVAPGSRRSPPRGR